jgi:ABC-2 type transport system ATP-binding protein
MLTAKNITKSFGRHQVLSGVDLTAEPGQIVGLLGVNGAGKTTLISILAGLDHPDSGSVTIAGIDALRHRRAAARHIGIAPQALGIYPTLTVRENLGCFAGLAGLAGRQAQQRIEEVACLLGLSEALTRSAGQLSGGQQRRLHTGMAILHRPEILFLDEPTVGSDVQSRTAILDIVADMAAHGTGVVYTTHYPAELERLDADIAVLDAGKITVRGSVQNVVDQWASSSVALRFHGVVPELDGWVEKDGALVPFGPVADPAAALAGALSAFGERAAGLWDLQIVRPSLESAYLAITGARTVESEELSHVVTA